MMPMIVVILVILSMAVPAHPTVVAAAAVSQLPG